MNPDQPNLKVFGASPRQLGQRRASFKLVDKKVDSEKELEKEFLTDAVAMVRTDITDLLLLPCTSR